MDGAPPPAAKTAGTGSGVNVQSTLSWASLPKRTDCTCPAAEPPLPGVTTDHSMSSVLPVLLAHTVAG